jgi:hypothetical protein
VLDLPPLDGLLDAHHPPRDEHHMALVHLDQFLAGEQPPQHPMLFELSSNAERQRSLQGETGEEVAVGLEILLEMS